MIQTKKQLIDKAFKKIGKNPDVVDIEDEEYFDALMTLEAMMNEWYDLNIAVGWTSPSAPVLADIDTVSNLPPRAIRAVWLNLADKISGEYGKPLSIRDSRDAARSYKTLLAHYNKPFKRKTKPVLAGAGNKNSGCGITLPSNKDNNVVLPPVTVRTIQ